MFLKIKTILKNKKIKTSKILLILYLIIIFFGIFNSYFKDTKPTFAMPISKKVIVLDAGHGGFDPGKVSKDNTLEKDINLNIAKKLQSYLEQSNSFVLTTRIDDSALSNTKRDDLNERKKLANMEDIDLFISIHQNSFPKENVKGAQVFYYGDSEESKKLAEYVQNRLKEIDKTNKREAKANKEYYLLKKTAVPAIIIECGFLSNEEEKSKLKSEEYQNKIAWAIYMGILDYYSN